MDGRRVGGGLCVELEAGRPLCEEAEKKQGHVPASWKQALRDKGWERTAHRGGNAAAHSAPLGRGLGQTVKFRVRALDPAGHRGHACVMNRALGIDTGDARIGLALSDELRMLAHPLESVPAGAEALEHIARVARAKSVDVVVVGLPRNMNGSKGPAAEKAEAFAAALGAALPGVRMVLWDERLTTVAAQRALHEAGRNTRQSRAVIDQVAAQLILQGWLDSQGTFAL